MVLGMTNPLSDADQVATALHLYADAIKLGQAPIPRHINTHALQLNFRSFMTLADNHRLTVDIVESGIRDVHYGRILLPFDRANLITDPRLTVRLTVTSLPLTDAQMADIETHNRECTPIDFVPADDPCAEMHRYGGGF